MGRVNVHGFTVVELMLFLAISSALLLTLMAGVNTNVTQQRYREGVSSYATFLQNQYAQVLNTRNEGTDDWVCEGSGDEIGKVKNVIGAGEGRGKSHCVLLGRAIEVKEDGKIAVASTVTGYDPNAAGGSTDPATDISNLSDIDTLKAFTPKLSAFNEHTLDLSWGATLKTIEGRPSEASILILRSPASGLIRMFFNPGVLPNDLGVFLDDLPAETRFTNCVHGDRGLLPFESITVDTKIAGPASIIRNQADSRCQE